ncbi:MAG: hypothetical protein GEU93_01350 [Propionibacteriales bacterium]|nr:hypothetical protein [Propionibacteriales bacterium]
MQLTPAHLGERVVVRRILPGESGPSGGPAMTDVLGVLEEWGQDTIRVRRADGLLVEIALADAVSGKPIPPPPQPHRRRRPAPE